ncbi:TIGR03086 family metal-binding protein [Georgenia alba]|uniref:TIGR03086 family metal-binding protein n=1 Tax=Georgenia alba TaxID=2233858 RepID=A0ABW2QA79_9MICO
MVANGAGAGTSADEHREIAAGFTARVRGAAEAAWESPSPVAGWTARDVVRHLLEWFPAFLEGGTGIRLPAGPSVDEDPVAAWEHHTAAIQALLEDPETARSPFRHPRVPELPLADAVSQFYTADVFMHTWDLARATGQDERLDPERCRALYEGMLPMEELLRSSGQYGPRVPVPQDADWQTKMLGFIGRHV